MRRNSSTDRFLTALVLVSMLYTLLLGWGLLYRIVPFQLAYLLMALPCMAPIVWYAYGFLRVNDATQDFGLLLSALGWSCLLIALLAKHMALMSNLRAREAGTIIEDLGRSQTATVFFTLGLLSLLMGAFISARAWMMAARRGEIE